MKSQRLQRLKMEYSESKKENESLILNDGESDGFGVVGVGANVV